jgi:hypothetical protein
MMHLLQRLFRVEFDERMMIACVKLERASEELVVDCLIYSPGVCLQLFRKTTWNYGS